MVNTSGAQAAIGNKQSLNVDAARYYNALVLNIKRETGIDIIATEGTRTYARQLELYNLYRAGKGNPAWAPTSRYAYHLSGNAVDVGSGVGYTATAASRAFYARAGRFGFRASVDGEPWHFEWRQAWVDPKLNLATVNADPIPPVEEDTPVYVFVNEPGGTIWLVSLVNGKKVAIKNPSDVTLLRRLKKNDANDPMLRVELDNLQRDYLSHLA